MIYLDSSAVLKLVRREGETDALHAWLDAHPDDPVATSELGRIEVIRAARRVGGQVPGRARAVLAPGQRAQPAAAGGARSPNP